MTERRFVRAVRHEGGIDGASHQELLTMVQHTDPIAVMQVSQRLLEAANKMDEISNELHAHMSGLDWQGDAAESFKTWGSKVSSSTMELASYSRNAGTYMASAGETLAAVKSGMPPVPHQDMETVSRYDGQPNGAVSTGGAIIGSVIPGVGGAIGSWGANKIADMVDSDWVTKEEAQAAQRRVEQAHNEAVQQMTRLTQAYEQSTTRLNSVPPPVFPPLPEGTGGRTDLVDVPIGGDGGGAGRGPGGGTTMPQPPRVAPPAPPRQPLPTPAPSPAPNPPHPGQTPGPPHNPVPMPAPGPTPPMPPGPVKDPGTGLDSTPTAPTLPNPRTPLPGGGGIGSGDYGGSGTGTGPVHGGGYPGGGVPIGGGYPGGGTTGGGRVGGGTPGTGGVPGTGGAPGAGGRTGGAAAASAGTGQAGRAGTPGMGGMPHGGGGMGGGGGAAGGAGGARGGGLVSRAGGTVGGQRGPASGREFTPGGTGLRGRAERGADGRAGQGGFGGGIGGANRKGKPQGKRPDYLTEDENTWTSGMGPVNPNVIE
ncbi:WXG100 family type VII secretion target [Kitasatospora sp. NPDC004531]